MKGLSTAFVAGTMRHHGYRVLEGPDLPVTSGVADSRKVTAGSLFAAFAGENTDGNLYVAEALERGAVAVVCQDAPVRDWPNATIVVAPDTTEAMAQLAHAWLKACSPKVVGITGTVGKTTAKDLIAAVVGQRFNTHKSEGNLNSREGLPLALMSLRRDHEVSVLEMAMDSKGEILELCRIAEPTVGVVLNVGLTHVSKLGSIEAIAEEKLSLARYLGPDGTAVINIDDPRLDTGRVGLECGVIPFSTTHRPDALAASNVTDRGLSGTGFDVHFAGGAPVHVRSPLPGTHTLPAALAAIAVGQALGMTLREAADAVTASTVGGRMETRTSDTGATLLDDRYNSSPASLAGALRLLARMPGQRIALLGRMAELGDHEDEEHRKAGRLAAACCDLLVAVGEPCRALVSAAKDDGLVDSHHFEDKVEAAALVRERMRPGDHVLIKASRSQAFETLIPYLEGAA